MTSRRRGERFFAAMGVVLTLVVIAGFAPMTLFRPDDLPAITSTIAIHGAVFLGWYLLYTTQALLPSTGRLALHRTFGAASPLIVVALVALGFIVTRGAVARPDWSIAGLPPAGSAIFPTTDVVNFLVAYALGFANRRRPAVHKRFMLLAGILMIDPAMARIVFVLIGGPPPLVLALELGLIGALFAYDIATRRRPHWASVTGLALYVAAFAMKLTLPSTATWLGFSEKVFG